MIFKVLREQPPNGPPISSDLRPTVPRDSARLQLFPEQTRYFSTEGYVLCLPSDPDTQCCLSEASLGAHFKCHFSGCLLRPHSRARPSCCLPLLVYVCALCPGFPASSSFIISPLATRALSPALLSTSVPGLSTLSLLCCRGLLWLHSGLAPPRPRHVLRS